jgi:hypothetical protein
VTSDQHPAPANLPQEKATPGTYWIEGCVDPTTGLDDSDVIFFYPFLESKDSSNVQPVS